MAGMEDTTGQTLVKCTDTEDGNYSEITQQATHRLKQRKDSGRVNTLATLECSYDEVERKWEVGGAEAKAMKIPYSHNKSG